jgi:hypothetical protein
VLAKLGSQGSALSIEGEETIPKWYIEIKCVELDGGRAGE